MNQTFNKPDQKIAFIYASWHKEIVLEAVTGFTKTMSQLGYTQEIDLIAVSGAYEIPLQAKLLANSGYYQAIACSALVVDGGIYRHDFVAQTVVSALMDVQLASHIPVLNAVLTPHNFHSHSEHNDYYFRHFRTKGEELANACDGALQQTFKSLQLKG